MPAMALRTFLYVICSLGHCVTYDKPDVLHTIKEQSYTSNDLTYFTDDLLPRFGFFDLGKYPAPVVSMASLNMSSDKYALQLLDRLWSAQWSWWKRDLFPQVRSIQFEDCNDHPNTYAYVGSPLGTYENQDNIIHVCRAYYYAYMNMGEDWTRILTHELGHILGLPHTNDDHDVMYSYSDLNGCLTYRRPITWNDMRMAYMGGVTGVNLNLCQSEDKSWTQCN